MDVERARNLARSLLAADLPQRWCHVQAVASVARCISSELAIDAATVESSAWLHDIGYSPSLAETGFHPLDGARYLQGSGWPAAVCSLVAHHTCSRVEAGARGLLADLEREFIDDPGLERDALWAADAITGPTGERMTVDGRLADVVARYGENHVVTECMRQITPALAAALDRVRHAGWSDI